MGNHKIGPKRQSKRNLELWEREDFELDQDLGWMPTGAVKQVRFHES